MEPVTRTTTGLTRIRPVHRVRRRPEEHEEEEPDEEQEERKPRWARHKNVITPERVDVYA